MLEFKITEEEARRKGIATEAVQMMMEYANVHLKVNRFVAKIAKENEPSLQLFKKLGFELDQFVEMFHSLL